ncbi:MULTISPECIES: CDP-diacylglycerol--serine O-phosphatidyltransferase [unclassified Campylobacter]|uniref:CDP-diacylglycerol--serine O-phosphatidyltransferase n=1 Tax=unclassified Campylobacter TaxID=2593542 RepID=UPI0022E9FE5F|nr:MULTISPECIES: CDP-diacylglycerol--serine O-phosphatidyltransferase [unclassified Campylobacter]MDA3055556.1 CDP-diacylglycerol--serine O-phosphatidyltransferase [Campylobacter sp. CN_NA1]MDA3064754.1 CDP-diacylglycerol--serine O-phosphatidyltransferase [Campylobacter sp. CN_NE4]MDA3068422.1 CDP-diacylglycerol--serine O-phosphatidyltransferase [Campylobacter sp. CN_NE3]MDA3082265.1 CDP-diacylglycerol--serine O-phosphatidyltransferase [Campylobacter sp. CN_EL2]MDA3083900.1 CDP-diacylglycerol-
MSEERDKLIYILPNLFTAASIFFGVISIISTLNGNFTKAIIFIFLSLVCDGLDGRVARLTNTASKFGVEFDSLADIIAFGVAPAFLFYIVIGKEFGRVGSLLTAIYIIFGAIRLARFNVTTGTYDPSVFIGLPIPTAAIWLAVMVGVYLEYSFFMNLQVLYLLAVGVISVLMVSNVRFPSFKKINLKKMNFYKVLIALVIIFSLLYIRPLELTAVLTSGYILYGIVRAIYYFYDRKIRKKVKDEQ